MGANFGGTPYDPIDADTLNAMYSQQAYGVQNASQYSGWLGHIATGYANLSSLIGGSYSGMGQQMYNAQMHEMQTRLGTPTQPKPARQDPEEIAWLKGRIKEVEWRG